MPPTSCRLSSLPAILQAPIQARGYGAQTAPVAVDV